MSNPGIRFALVALAFGAGAFAQEPAPAGEGIQSIQFERVSHSRVQITVHYNVSSVADIGVEYGPDLKLGYRTPTIRATPDKKHLRTTIGGLAPDSIYYFRPTISREAKSVGAWECSDAKTFVGFACGAANEPPYFRTGADPGPSPVFPHPPKQADLPMPAITGKSFRVAVNAANRCTNFEEILQEAAAADSSLNHEVIIPAGATCVGSFRAPAKSGPGTVVVRTSAPDDKLPPVGSRISPSYISAMATLSPPPNVSRWLEAVFDIKHCQQDQNPCSHGWRFVGIRFAPLPFEEFKPDVYKIVDARNDRGGVVLTVDRDIEFGEAVNVGVSGMRGAPRVNRIHRPHVMSPRELLLRQTSLAETYQPGTGHVVNAAFIPLESCSGGKPLVCRTAGPHGLQDPQTAKILRKEGINLISAAGEFAGIRSGHLVRIENSSMPGLNGFWGVDGGVPNRLQVRSAPKGNCTEGCGDATPYALVQIGGTGRVDGSHVYTVMSDTEVRFDYLDGGGQPFTGGFLVQDPHYRRSMISFGSGNQRLVLDRSIVDGGGFPLRYQRGFTLAAQDSAILNSHFQNFSSWRPLNPAYGLPDPGMAGFNLASSQAIEFADAARVTVSNNTFLNCVGITLFSQPGRKTEEMTPSDVVISRNTFRIDDEYIAGHELSNGRYYAMRHVLELKRGIRFRFTGNVVDGGWADFTPTGPAIALYPVGDIAGNEVSDIEISNNTFRRISSGIQMPTEHRLAGMAASPTERVLIHNNVFESIDFHAMRSAPSGVNGRQKSTNFGGYFLMISGSIEDLTVTHNTVFDNRGRGPWTFRYAGGRSGGVNVTDNIFTHNHDNGYGGTTPSNQVGGILPAAQGSPSDIFNGYFTQTPNPDPRSSFARNLILPGVRDSSSPESYGSGGNVNFTKQNCAAYYKGFPEVVCVDGQTARERFRQVFPDEGNLRYPEASMGGPGADVDALEAAQGALSNLEAHRDSSGTSTLSYRTAAGESCVVDFSPDARFEEFVRTKDSGAGSERFVVIEGAQPGAEYHYRVQCSSSERRGTFMPGSPLRPSRSRGGE